MVAGAISNVAVEDRNNLTSYRVIHHYLQSRGLQRRLIGENLEQIRGAVRDAVCCHFQNKDMPRTIRLRIVKDEVMTV
ncbi:hypothetical protein [Thermanaeromonas toyohensis]|uniref:hypothetical protein n=1 Tax=Thermanaeromonas toyohensis TaxID=161154 RepID=UPI0018D3AAE8|nr:hypothetical protein [Thermanaeromonas toyohensis]